MTSGASEVGGAGRASGARRLEPIGQKRRLRRIDGWIDGSIDRFIAG